MVTGGFDLTQSSPELGIGDSVSRPDINGRTITLSILPGAGGVGQRFRFDNNSLIDNRLFDPNADGHFIPVPAGGFSLRASGTDLYGPFGTIGPDGIPDDIDRLIDQGKILTLEELQRQGLVL